jgi:hypothetical protein
MAKRSRTPEPEPVSEVQSVISDLRSVLSDSEIAGEIGCGISTISMWGAGNRAKRTGELMFKLYRLHAEKCAAKAA